MTVILAVRSRRVRRRRPGEVADPGASAADQVPRVARMLALAHHWRGLIRDGVVKDQASLSRLVGVTRARVTQVMGLLYLAPDIQEEILDASQGAVGEVRHHDLLLVSAEPAWQEQRSLWASVVASPYRRPYGTSIPSAPASTRGIVK